VALHTGESPGASRSPGVASALADLVQAGKIRNIGLSERVSRLEENVAADALRLRADQLSRLAAIAPPAGDRYADMTPLGR
jgi:aryl-alcohol dehydrogenase-like predicted oxidoreductase